MKKFKLRILGQKQRCFIAHRFSSEEMKIAEKLAWLLNYLNVDAISGAGYQPTSIREKIKKLLSQRLDFIIMLVTKKGETAWIRDEVGKVADRIPIIPILEVGAKIAPGLIIGDIEYIRFTRGHIYDSIPKLIEGIEYIRTQAKTA